MALRSEPLDPIGVELGGVGLGEGVDAATFASLRDAVLGCGLVLVRDVPLAPEAQVALGHCFGPLEGQEYSLGSPHPEMIRISNVGPDGEIVTGDSPMMKSIRINEQWHTDSSFREHPASVSIFAAVEVPPEGGDTFFADLQLAWSELPEERRAPLRGLRAIHDYAEAYRRAGGSGLPAAISDGLVPVTHPIVRVHPETGAESLYVSGHVHGVEGMEPAEGRALVQGLVDWATRPGRVYRHRWRPGDVMLWDNRRMLHRAQGFDDVHRRVMHHVRVAGCGPVVAA